MLKLKNKEGREALVVEGSKQHQEFLDYGFTEPKTTKKRTTKKSTDEVSTLGDSKKTKVRI